MGYQSRLEGNSMSIPRNLGNFADNVNTNGKVEVTGINATGTPSGSTALLGNGTWGTVTTAPAGSTGQVQYNNAGAFGAISSGTSGQVLTSAGAGVAPAFATVSAGFTLATPVSASGSSITFTGIPAGVKQINVMLNYVVTSTNVSINIRLGTSGGIGTTGYASVRSRFFSGSTAGNRDDISLIEITGAAPGTSTVSGLIVFSLQDATNNYWTYAGNLSHEVNGYSWFISGRVNLIDGLSLTQLRLFPDSGTFTSGTFNISYI